MIFNAADELVNPLIAPAFNTIYDDPTRVLAIFGSETDLRVALQLSAFTMHSTAAPLDGASDTEPVLARIVIPADVREDFRNVLDILGLRRSALFPDLENLARELTTREFVE